VCGVPASARALSVNVTVTGATSGGYITLYPGDAPLPVASTLTFAVGQTRSNNAIMALSRDGLGTLSTLAGLPAGNQVHFILDVTGYFE
jgi:hypothetical protein